MFIICESAACVLAALIGATLLFTACVMFLLLEEGGRVLAQTLRKLTHGATQLKTRGMVAEPPDS
jgi:hypothetical protein